MRINKIKQAATEARRFLDRVDAALEDIQVSSDIYGSEYESYIGNKGTAALRRSSLDLTRALSELRAS
jgi:hypothetical protein